MVAALLWAILVHFQIKFVDLDNKRLELNWELISASDEHNKDRMSKWKYDCVYFGNLWQAFACKLIGERKAICVQ